MIVIFCVTIDDVCVSSESFKLHHQYGKYYNMINLMTSLLYIITSIYNHIK